MYSPDITAHSGCEGTPRDSLESIKLAAMLGADNVEIDVRRAGDGTLHISHNRVSEAEYAEKPLLETALEHIADTAMGVNVDLKEPRTVYDVLDMCKRCGFEGKRLILSGDATAEQLAADPTIATRGQMFLDIAQILKLVYLDTMLKGHIQEHFVSWMNIPQAFVYQMPLSEETACIAAEIALSLHVSGINMPHQVLTETLAGILNRKNVPFSVWTVNEPEEIDRCIRLGARNITTLSVKTALERRGQTPGKRI